VNVRPMGVVVSPDGSRVFVSTGRGGSVVSVSAATGEIIGSVIVGARPWGLALSPDGNYLYTANGTSDDVTLVDAHTLQVIGKIAVGQRPWDVVTIASEVVP
jgi:YVTN family beta-propeller protein